MATDIPSGETAEAGGGAAAGPTGANAQQPPTNPPYLFAMAGGPFYKRVLEANDDGIQFGPKLGGNEAELRAAYPGQVWPEKAPPVEETTPPPATQNTTPAPADNGPSEFNPLDQRLLFLSDTTDKSAPKVIMSYTWDPALTAPMVEGFVMATTDSANLGDGKQKPFAVQDTNTKREDIFNNPSFNELIGVPAMMSNMSYINFIGSGGKEGIKYLVDRENQPRWYDQTSGLGKDKSSVQELTVTNLIKWSDNNKRYPYRYQDFVFLKWWKKIPLNYMITLRRYTRAVGDNVSTEFDKSYVGPDELKLRDAAHAVTFLGEDSGNKISTILGPIEAGLLWKDIKADVWEVSSNGSPASADSPFPNLAKTLGFLTAGPAGAQDTQGSSTPPDPYNNGPYANKVIGPLTVITGTKGRERGVKFKHDISLVFEYSARSIGGVNSKAAMLDILSNLMILTFNTASFWGGANRFMPQGGGGGLAPFLGGKEGRKAFLEGNPAGFFKAVSEQFSGAMSNIGDLFNKLLEDPVGGLKEMAGGAMSNYMKMNTAGGRGQMVGIHTLLTGDPVGEWHVTVGNPMNPMMMIGNLICTGIKIEFNDELGPDDFPTELKATISLEHGMARDKSAIESMFNKGGGRLYSLPPGMKEADLFPSVSDTIYGPLVNSPQGKTKSVSRGKKKSNPLLGDPTAVDKIASIARNSTAPAVNAVKVAVYNHGFASFTSK